jgi:hypothetical protein
MTKMDKILTLTCVGALALAWAALQLFDPPTPRPQDSPDPTPAHASAPAPAPSITRAESDANLEKCRSKLKAAAQLGLLADMSFDDGRPRVVIGRTWYGIDYTAKTGLAETAACFFLAGDTTRAIRFDIRDNMTGKVVATWSGTRLTVE